MIGALLLSFVAALYVSGLEYLSRIAPSYTSWLGVIPASQVVAGFMFYQLQQSSPNLPATFVAFSAFIMLDRVVISVIAGHSIGVGTWVSCGLLLLATAARFWRP